MENSTVDEDKNLFIQAFAGPTEQYRFYEEHRHQNPPLFLSRCLTYINHKKCRAKKSKRRSSGRINTLHSIIEKLTEQKRGKNLFITITFSGFFCDEITHQRFAEVQVIHKDSQTKLASIIVEINPVEMLKGLSTISLPTTDVLKITSTDGKLLEQTTCILLFKLRLIENESKNDYLDRETDTTSTKTFESELELCDGNGLIMNGEKYIQFNCNANTNQMAFPRQTMWNLKNFVKKSLSLSVIHDDDLTNSFLKPAKLKINLQWSHDIRPSSENKENGKATPKGAQSSRRVLTRSRSTGSITIRRSFGINKSNESIQCLVYQFIHRNYRQKTEIWGYFKCPWCSVKPTHLYVLLKHLTLCHDRFKFKYVPGTNEIRIDVFVNKRADECRIDPFSRHGTKFNGYEPHKRTIMTSLVVCRPERCRPRLAEFFVFDANDIKRKFYHSTNGLPLQSNEIDIDSEDEIDPRWLRENTVRMIDDFVDVNDGEKKIMKLWNLHILKCPIISESQVLNTIISFIERHGEEILANNLYRNCMIHFTNLFNYGVISDGDFYKCVQRLQLKLMEKQSLRDGLAQRYDEQLKYTMSKIKINKNSTAATSTMKRPSNRNVDANMKKRLRSHSRGESIQKTKIKRIDATTTTMKTPSSSSSSTSALYRAARKMAKITN